MQDIEKLVLRLKKEKEGDKKVKVDEETPYDAVEKEGFLAGVEDAYSTGFKEFSEAQDSINNRRPYSFFDRHASKQTKEYLYRFVLLGSNDNGHPYYLLLTHEGVNKIFKRGWEDGFLHIWNQVKDKLD